jgi:hypothetical protein
VQLGGGVGGAGEDPALAVALLGHPGGLLQAAHPTRPAYTPTFINDSILAAIIWRSY